MSSSGRTPSGRLQLHGCFTAITTPFTADGSAIDYGALEEQIGLQAAGKVTGIVVSGTTGESPTLEREEYQELVERGVEMGHRHGLVVVAGAGSNSTAHAVEMQRFAAKAGADATLSVNPYYNKPTQEGLFRHYTTIADAADLPVILYNVPGRSASGLTIETIRRLSEHANIVALKDAAGSVDMTSETCATCPGLTVLSGDDPLTLPMMAVGAVGVISVVSNIAPALVSGLCTAWAAGKREEALTAHREILPLARAMFVESNPIPVKAAMKLMGIDTGAVRLPMTAATPATIERVRQALLAAELLQGAGRTRAVRV